MMIVSTVIDPALASATQAAPARPRGGERRPPRHLDFGMPALERRLNALLLRHARLDRQLRREARAPFKDGLVLQRLKRLKLLVKDEMASLKAVLRAERMPAMPLNSPRGSSRQGTA